LSSHICLWILPNHLFHQFSGFIAFSLTLQRLGLDKKRTSFFLWANARDEQDEQEARDHAGKFSKLTTHAVRTHLEGNSGHQEVRNNEINWIRCHLLDSIPGTAIRHDCMTVFN